MVDIEAKIEGKEIPTYDITEIPHSDFVSNKKYTKEYIDDEIIRTIHMPVIDESNVVKGNGTDLYDQLELTRSFSISEIKKVLKEAKKEKEKREREEKKAKKKIIRKSKKDEDTSK
jgi:hypothetical protein